MPPRAYSSSIRDAHVEQTRAMLLDTARALLVDQGIEALTLPKLAQAAGVSVPTVYRHFPVLDDLWRELLAWLRPRLGMTEERLLAVEPGELARVPLDNFPRYEAEAALLRPLMESRAFNRVRVSSMGQRAAKASALIRPHVPELSDGELAARMGALWMLNSPQAWRWLRDTWGLDADEAAQAAGWAMGVLRDALTGDTRKPETKKKQKKRSNKR